MKIAEDYATLDLLSGGRVELVLGRGNLYEHVFDAFGQDPARSRQMYDERVALVVQLLGETQLQWEGATRPPFRNYTTQPRPLQQSTAGLGGWRLLPRLGRVRRHRRACRSCCPGVLGPPRSFVRLVDHYRRRWAELGHDPPVAGSARSPTRSWRRRRRRPAA